MIGRIHRIGGNRCEVHTEGGLYLCRLRGRLRKTRGPSGKLAAVGDQVELSPGSGGEGIIEEILPRRSVLSRHEVLRPSVEQVIVANVDVLIILQAARDPDFSDLVLDKCTVMAARNKLPCLIVVNKSDLGAPDLSAYESSGFACLRTSARTGLGLDLLRDRLKGRTSVFLGPSGVGKSSLLNALDPGLDLKVGAVSRTGEGRHTTSWAEIRPVAQGWVADTPGLEFFTSFGATAQNLKDYFLDFVDRAEGCRYRDCSHTQEGGCAVRGHVAPSRYRNYLEMREKLQV